MKVFVAGASGVLGRPTVRRLVAAGHDVVGMTRREERAAEIRGDGAEAVVCDVFDAEGLREAVVAARPEVVVHLLTSLPQRYSLKEDYLAPTNEVRRVGTRNLIAAARAAEARRLVAESIAFAYEPEGGWVKDEEAPLQRNAPEPFGGAVAAVTEMEQEVGEAEGLEGLVLRFGWLYGPGTYYGRGGKQAEEVQKRRFPIVGKGNGVFSLIHSEDAAAATVAAVERGAPGIYNVADDEPAPLREWLPVYAEALGAKPPRRLPVWLVRLAAGEMIAGSLTQMRGADNSKAKRELGWQPEHASWRQGFAASLRA
ncbi:MAG TPA: NAD(P)-dependent oxidoreductase [Solirubrobacterales bacterium]|nr:NAD(P)-dependent oxidoreductase [Solirubrobacterales bacterium]